MNEFDSIPFSSNDDQNNSIDDFFSEIPFDNSIAPLSNENILILDNRIKDIPAKNSKVTFKRTSIILPVIAFVFVSILGMYLFINYSKAETDDLIRIEENKKFGYIDTEGTIVTRAKYPYGTEFYKGYAIVKNNNNLYGILNGKGVVEIPFGNFYYIGLFGNRYIASKITNEGLKQALLDYKLDELTSYKYDSLSYAKNGMYLFTRGETMGILNREGKEIYSFMVDEVDDRNIDIEISDVDEDLPLSERYAKVKVNNSSTIINLATGKEIYNYTLKDIKVLKNNVFYIKADNKEENSTYIVINNSQVKLKTNSYKRVRVDDYSSLIAIGIDDDTNLTYINLTNQKPINDNTNNDYYYGNGLVLEKSHDFSADKDVYNIISSKKIEGSFTNYKPVNNTFYNNLLKVELYEGKYNFIDKKGTILNDSAYDEATEFNKNGYAIVSNDKNYGIINNNGKEVVKLSHLYIGFLDEDLFKLLSETYKKDLFIYQDKNTYGFINSKDNIEIEAIYDDVKYVTDKYPIILAKYSNDLLLVNLAIGKELPIRLKSDNIKIKSNYIVIDNNYYNYSGKLIYTAK
ncbi:MAG: WG repeat-containing protein [Bacilli bacterium]|nr:WG repeat-containing protein [Bacilli bacterium]